MELLIQPFSKLPLGDLLKACLRGEFGSFHTFQAAIAFVKSSGVRHVTKELKEFSLKQKKVEIIIGIDHYGTSKEGLEQLLSTLGETGEIFINHTIEWHITFHPKIYLFEGEERALIIIGSGNLTEGGLYTNDEVSSINWLDKSNENDSSILDELKYSFKTWSENNSIRLDQDLLFRLVDDELILTEAESYTETHVENKNKSPSNIKDAEEGEETYLFGKSVFKRVAPKFRKKITKSVSQDETATQPADTIEITNKPIGFVMTLQRTDVGTGQTSPGTSRRSPEIFIPLKARDYFPEFWGWKDEFTEDVERSGKFDRLNVKMRIGGETVSVNMMTWPVKHDFRLRCEALRSAGNVGDILRIEKTENSQEFSYYVEIIPQNTSAYQEFLDLCVNKTRNSTRVWGYYA